MQCFSSVINRVRNAGEEWKVKGGRRLNRVGLGKRGGRCPANTWKHSGIYRAQGKHMPGKGGGDSKVLGYPEQSGEARDQETSAALSGLWRFPITTVECSLFPKAPSGSDRRKLRVRG